MERLTKMKPRDSHIPCYVDTFEAHYTITSQKNKFKAFDKLGRLENIEEKLGCPLEVLFGILDESKTLVIDENKVGELYEREKWKKIKSFIPYSFSHTYIYCDVWYEDNFRGIRDTLVIPIKQYKKTWWLKEDRSE